MRNNNFIFILLFTFISCSSKDATNKDSAKKEDIPFHGIEIPICYDYDWQIISFDISINGRDTLFAIFDTGADGVAIPKSLKDNYFKYKDSLCVTAGKYTKVFTEDVNFVGWNVGRRAPDDDLYAPRVLIGWDFFEGTIMELSFKNKYIRILDDTEYLRDYDSISLIRRENGLYIPASISIQEEKIDVLSLIDTGFNNTFISDKSLFANLNYATSEKAYGIYSGYKKFTGYFLLADTIKVGNSYICNKNICVTDYNEISLKRKKQKSLLGCSFFENFTLVFDFKKDILYLKPINN